MYLSSSDFTEEIFEKDPELAVYSVPYLGSVNFTCFSNSIHEWFSTAEFYQAQTGSALSASVFVSCVCIYYVNACVGTLISARVYQD